MPRKGRWGVTTPADVMARLDRMDDDWRAAVDGLRNAIDTGYVRLDVWRQSSQYLQSQITETKARADRHDANFRATTVAIIAAVLSSIGSIVATVAIRPPGH